MGSVVIIVLGPAGSGKSTLVSAYSKWLLSNGYSVVRINLDPAADYVPYEPDYDIRSLVSARELAIKEGLGPNSALIAAMDVMCKYLGDVVEYVVNCGADYVLVDTPGQMEVFLFRDASIKLVSSFKDVGLSTYALFIVDAELLKRVRDYAFLSLLSLATQLRLGIDVVPVINKVDLLSKEYLSGDVVRDYELMIKELSSEEESLYTELLKELLNVITKYFKATEVPKVSALKGSGMEDLHRLIHEISCTCGDLT